MTSVIVQGSIQSYIDESSDEESEENEESDVNSKPIDRTAYFDKDEDDDEEELERFDDTTLTKSNAIAILKDSKVKEVPKKLSLIEAMETSVAAVEKSISIPSESSSATNHSIQNEDSNINKFATNNSKEGEPDAFGISYKPFKKIQTIYGNTRPSFTEDPEIAESLSNLKVKSTTTTTVTTTTSKSIENSNNSDNDDEFDFENDNQKSHASEDALEKALNRAALNTDEIISEGTEPESMEIEPEEISSPLEEEMINIREGAQNAFNELKSIYGSGLGDVEVRLLDTNIKTEYIPSKSNRHLVSSMSSVHKSVMKEVIEEGDEDAEMEEEIREVEVIKQTTTAQQQLENEWNNLGNDNNINTKITNQDVDEVSVDRITRSDNLQVTYDELFDYLQHLDLSTYKSLIITKEEQSTSWLNSGKKLKFPGNEEALEFPFLIAQLDYNPICPEHLGCLRRIYKQLIHPNLNDNDMFFCPAYGPHWERIGFQGLDPITDLNRSMKMFAVMQALHLVDRLPFFCQALHRLSGSDVAVATAATTAVVANPFTSNKSDKKTSALDKSWPFMCVSVMFTREAIQSLRRGDLNKKCNKRQDILSVVHDFHHACFYDFARRLNASPTKHHAEILKDLREYCQTNSSQLMRVYRNALKNSTNLSDSLIGSFTIASETTKSSIAQSNIKSKTVHKEDNTKVAQFDDLEAVGEATATGTEGGDGNEQSNEGFWSSIGLGSRADKFKSK